MDNLNPCKYAAIAAALGDDILRTVPVSNLNEYFPGTTPGDWSVWRKEGLLKILPRTNKILLADAAEFLALAGKQKYPERKVKSAEENGDVDITDIERKMLNRAREFEIDNCN